MLRVKNEHFGHARGLDRRVILAMIRLVSANRFQDGHPLVAVGRVANRSEREQIAILHVDQARGHFRAFERPTYAKKVPALVMRKRGVADAMKTMASENNAAAEAVRARGRFFLRIEAAEREVQAIEVFPHFAGNSVADGASVFASFRDALHDGAWVVRAKSKELENVWRGWLPVKLAKKRLFASHGKNRFPPHAVWLRSLFKQCVKSHV